MPIDFTLTPEQKGIQAAAREFAQQVLKPAVRAADAEPDPQKGFRMMKPIYELAYEHGLVTGGFPREYGGGGMSNLDLQVAFEEICAVDCGFAFIVGVNALALFPVLAYGTEEQKQRFIGQACNDPTHSYLCGYAASEPAGMPGGTANFDHPSPQAGIRTTADLVNGEYVLNGRKFWPSSSAGWDMKGADMQSVVVRTDRTKGGREGLSVLMVPRGTPGVRYEPCIDKMGMRINQNCDIVFENARVPAENLVAEGNGELVINNGFTFTGPVVGIAAVGVARAAYEYVLDWCKTYTAGGTDPIIYHQNVGYMLADIAMRIEACRYLSWKTAHYLDTYGFDGAQGLSAMTKVYTSETCTQVVYDCMRVMGQNAYDRAAHPLDKLMRDMLGFPIFDGGNMGMQRRKIWGLMADERFDPRAYAACDRVHFGKENEGIGAVTTRPVPLRELAHAGR